MTDTRLTPAEKTWQFFWRAEDAWHAMFEDCEKAAKSIDFEQYILRNDNLGRTFLSLFARKVKENVAVRLMCDTVGSWTLYISDIVSRLRDHGVNLHFFNPLNWRNAYSQIVRAPRNHSKTMVIDRRIAYTGGVCFDHRMSKWRDTHIRLTGDVTTQVQRSFNHVWNHQKNGDRYRRPPSPCCPPERDFTYVTANPSLFGNPIYRQLKQVINQAEEYLYFTSPFFIPSRSLSRLMRKAAERGVDVRLLVSEVSDVRVADFVSQSYYGKLLRSGVKVYLYTETVLHAKTVVSDDHWATVGSMNLDHLSLFHNHEANVIIGEKNAIAELRDRFIDDLKASRELTYEAWRNRPLLHKMLGRAGRFFKHLM